VQAVRGCTLFAMSLTTKERERDRFLQVARRFKEATDVCEADRLQKELAEPVFGVLHDGRWVER
jgi:hypothetical protein